MLKNLNKKLKNINLISLKNCLDKWVHFIAKAKGCSINKYVLDLIESNS